MLPKFHTDSSLVINITLTLEHSGVGLGPILSYRRRAVTSYRRRAIDITLSPVYMLEDGRPCVDVHWPPKSGWDD